MQAGRKFHFFEVMGTNVLANEVVRHFSNLNLIRLTGDNRLNNEDKGLQLPVSLFGILQSISIECNQHD